mgnify:CR=1 FL=1
MHSAGASPQTYRHYECPQHVGGLYQRSRRSSTKSRFTWSVGTKQDSGRRTDAYTALWGTSGDMAEHPRVRYTMCAGPGDRATLASDPSTEAGGYTAGRGPAADGLAFAVLFMRIHQARRCHAMPMRYRLGGGSRSVIVSTSASRWAYRWSGSPIVARTVSSAASSRSRRIAALTMRTSGL